MCVRERERERGGEKMCECVCVCHSECVHLPSLHLQTSDEYDRDVHCVESNFPYYNPNSNLTINKTYFDPSSYSSTTIPTYKDWREEGVVTEVKDQVHS